MKQILISIIVPIYNAELFLHSSLSSIFCQDTSECEIILINDGSKDNSLSILQEYKARYSNINVIDKTNEGVSATRNRGLDECNGEYICFMDADDILHPQLLSLLKNEIKTSHPDMVVWELKTFYSKPKYNNIPTKLNIEQVENSNQEAFNYLMNNGLAVSMANKLIRRDLVNNTIRLDTSMTYGEDLFFCWKVILLSKNIRYIHYPLYYYKQSNTSATSRFHPHLYEHYRKAFDDMYHFVKKYKIDTEYILKSLDYHFACRIPALTNMETRAPYNRDLQKKHLSLILEDEYIQRGLQTNPMLNSKIYILARKKDINNMLKHSRITMLKSKLLYPLKKLLK